jgi:penicillin-binding protein 2
MLIRQYPGGPAFSHILGYVGPINDTEWEDAQTDTGSPVYDQDDVVGRGGVEQALEEDLRGAKGGRWIQVDTEGVERFELLERRRESTPGLSAQLTINKAFQEVVVQALQDGIRVASEAAMAAGKEKVGAGVAIAMDPRNGEILAMSSLPTFDNQVFVDGISQALYDVYQDPKSFEPLLDRAIGGLFPPGSTLKPLLACAGLQENVITPEKKFICKGRIRVPWSWDETQGNDYPCWLYDTGHGEVDIYKGIAESCDIYFYNVGAPHDKPEEPPNADFIHYYDVNDTVTKHYFEGLRIERIERYLKEAFGFGQKSGIELAGEEEGLVPNPKWLFQSDLNEYWSVGDTINVSIGQGHLLCTPLQLLNGTARIANGGTLWRPHVIKALLDDEGNIVQEFPATPLQTVPLDVNKGLASIDAQHLAVVREGMRRTVTEGTAKDQITFTEPVIGAKSGTAEFGEAIDGKYTKGHAWFSAFAPFDNPEIAVIVLVVGGQQGSVYAGPIANRILDAYFHTPGMRTG